MSLIVKKIYRDVDSLREGLREALNEATKPVRTIAAEAEISRSNLHNFKYGERELKFENLQKLADYFNVKYEIKNF